MDVDDLLERSLRHGPPDESRFNPATIDLGLALGGQVVLDVRRTSTSSVRPYQAGLVTERPLRGFARAIVVAFAAVVIAVGGFVVGRSTTTGSASAQPTSSPAPTPIIQEPGLPSRPGQVFDEANQHGSISLGKWVVCPTDLSLPCGTITPSKLDPGLADIYNNNVNPPVHGWPSAATLWSKVKAVTVSGDHLVVVADAHPIQAFDAHLFSLEGPSGGPTGLTGVSSDPGTWYLDLGTLAAGGYVVAILLDEGTPTPSFLAIGVTVVPSP